MWGAVQHLLLLVLVLATATQAAHLVELKKRNVPIHEQHQILELLQLEESDQVPNIRLNSNFFGNLVIGDHKQEFEVVFDTGSDALWVYSDACSSCVSSGKHVFHRKTSHTYHKKDTPFSIKYGTGESHGTTGTDSMRLGDLEVSDQVFGQCDEPDDVMRGFPFDGIVGLSRPMFMDPNGLVPIMDTVKREHVLNHKKLANTFSFYLGRDEGEKSFLIFGGSHHMLHEGAVHWVPAMSKNIFWELPLDDILIHEKNGDTSVMNHSERSLERNFHTNVVHDSFAELMATDPYNNAPKAQQIFPESESHVSAHKKSHSHKAARARHNIELPGASADGYQFFSVAEPVLLEMESTVAMLELGVSAGRNHKHAHKQRFHEFELEANKEEDDFNASLEENDPQADAQDANKAIDARLEDDNNDSNDNNDNNSDNSPASFEDDNNNNKDSDNDNDKDDDNQANDNRPSSLEDDNNNNNENDNDKEESNSGASNNNAEEARLEDDDSGNNNDNKDSDDDNADKTADNSLPSSLEDDSTNKDDNKEDNDDDSNNQNDEARLEDDDDSNSSSKDNADSKQSKASDDARLEDDDNGEDEHVSNPFDVHEHLASVRAEQQAAKSAPVHRQTSTKESEPTTKKATTKTETKKQSKTLPAEEHLNMKVRTVGGGELLSDFPTTPGASINPCQQDSTHPCIVSMDSGHSLISGPPELVRKLKQYTTPSGPCTEAATANMPDVSFVIGGKLFTLTPMDYLIELEGRCTPAFRERPYRNGHDWVLGEHFMRTFYSVFDYDDMRVGLARLDNIKHHLDTILTR